MEGSRLTPGVVYRAVLLAFALVVAAFLFRELAELILAVLIVVILAVPLSAFASVLQRYHVPRAVGATLGLLIGLAAIGGLIAALVPVFNHEINSFTDSLPRIVASLRHRIGALTGTSSAKAGAQIQHFVSGYTHHPMRLLGPLASIGESIAVALGALIVILLTALYAAIRPEPLLRGLITIVPPAGRRRAESIVARLRIAYLGWLRGLAIGMLVLGSLTYAGLRLVDLQFAAFFAIFTAVAMIIPYFGALASSIPPILYALTISTGKGIVVALIYIVAHQLEGNVIQPLVVARAVKVHPALIAVGVIAVERLFGFVGLIVAVPVLATVQILVQELWVRRIEREGRDLLLARPGAVAAEPLLATDATRLERENGSPAEPGSRHSDELHGAQQL
jgi:predicted PurR-regulated permease PerM